MSSIDKKYHKLLNKILKEGFRYEDPNRKGVHRLQIPSYTIEHDFKDGFPAITTKQLYWKGVVGELLWILRGDTNIKYLVDNGINIWNKDAYNYYLKQCDKIPVPQENRFTYEDWLTHLKNKNLNRFGDIDRGYGAQLRNWTNFIGNNGNALYYDNVDQFAELINTLKTNPMATKKTVTFWNPAEKNECSLSPCHWSFEVLVEPLNERICLDGGTQQYQFTLKWHQHSCDSYLGIPFNIASYALLAQIIGEMTNMIPKGIIGDLSNVHIYEPHLDAVKEQLSRDVNKYGECELELPTHCFNDIKVKSRPWNLDGFQIDNCKINDFNLINYKSYPAIPAEMLAYS